MKEKLVSREVAELAKEKGFNWCVGYAYSSKGLHQVYDSSNYENMNGTRHEIIPNVYPNPPYYSVPTQALLQKWLREVHLIDCTPEYVAEGDGEIYYDSSVYSDSFREEELEAIDLDSKKSYEEALEEGLLTALNLI